MSKDLDQSDVDADAERMRREYEARKLLLHGFTDAPFATHVFEDVSTLEGTGEVYDMTQTGYDRPTVEYVLENGSKGGSFVFAEVKDGDLIAIPSLGLYGFMQEAWPTVYYPGTINEWLAEEPIRHASYHPTTGFLHVLKDQDKYIADNPRYQKVWDAARSLHELHHTESHREHLVKLVRKANHE